MSKTLTPVKLLHYRPFIIMSNNSPYHVSDNFLTVNYYPGDDQPFYITSIITRAELTSGELFEYRQHKSFTKFSFIYNVINILEAYDSNTIMDTQQIKVSTIDHAVEKVNELFTAKLILLTNPCPELYRELNNIPHRIIRAFEEHLLSREAHELSHY